MKGIPEVWDMAMVLRRLGLVVPCLILVASSVWAQDVDVCPAGWEEVARNFISAEFEEQLEDAAGWVHPDEREGWAEWKAFEWRRRAEKLSSMAVPVQERAARERQQAAARLEVAQFLCAADAQPGVFRVTMDPNGRNLRTVSMSHAEDRWWVLTGAVRLNAEQERVVTAYLRAVDEDRWDEAEAWVARDALPRFKGYRMEVAHFLSGSPVFAEGRKVKAARRMEEWSALHLRSEREPDGVIVVHAEFPTAESVACELVEANGAWRILMR